MVQVEYGPDRAVLSVCGDVTDELVIDLAARVRRLVDECFYDRIELEITSNGGMETALRYFVDALEGFRREGVSVTTRALTKAASAAAVMLSLGSWREAASGAVLTYHSMHVGGLDGVTSRSAAALHGVLASADRRMLERLADRGIEAGGGSPPPCEEAAASLAPGDWDVVRRLAGEGLGGVNGGAGTPAIGAAALERFRGTVAECARDAAGLRRLYECLFTLDLPISPALAREMRLLDAVVPPRGAAANDGREGAGGGLRIPEWRAAFRPDGRVSRGLLCRHVLILGETGSGKTASGVLPAVAALFDRRHPVSCALVVDPKREIGEALAALEGAGGAEVRAFDPKPGPGGPTLNLMAGPQWSLDGDMAAGRYRSAARRMLVRTGTLASTSPGAVLSGGDGGHREFYWPAEGAQLGVAALALALLLVHRRREVFAGLDGVGPRLSESPRTLAALRRFGEEAGFLSPEPGLERIARRTIERARAEGRAAAEGDRDETAPSSGARKALVWFARRVRRAGLYKRSAGFRSDFKRIVGRASAKSSPESLRAAAEELPGASLRCLDDAELRPSPSAMALGGRVLERLFRMESPRPAPAAGGARPKRPDGADAPAVSRSRVALGAAWAAAALRPFAGSPEAVSVLDDIEGYWLSLAGAGGSGQYAGAFGFGRLCFTEFSDPAPAWTLRFGVEPGGAPDGAVDFTEAVDDEERLRVVLVQPALGASGDGLVAKSLKACFFEAVLGSAKRRSGGADMPLVGYVADECHRFVTSDTTHGEQSFLDTCRSFGAFCVLACQSASSLEHALAEGGGSAEANRSALSVLLNNTCTKLLFRSTDDATRERLGRLCPAPASGPKVVDVRPPSTLRPGECYAVTADGRFERRQLEAFDLGRAVARIKAANRPAPGPDGAAADAGLEDAR